MHRLVMIGLGSILVASSIAAQVDLVVTEAEFLSALNSSQPAAIETREEVAAASSRVQSLSVLENPTFSWIREEPSGPAAQTDWLLSWKIPDLARGPEVEAGQRALDAATWRRQRHLADLRLSMRETYADWALASAHRARLSQLAQRLASLAEREARRLDRGETSGLAAQRLALAAAGVRARAALAAAKAETARAEARSWYPDLPSQAKPILPDLPLAPAQPEPWSNPTLLAAKADLEAARLEEQAAGRFVRSPEIALGWQEQEDGPSSIDGPTVGLAWSLPLFSRNQANRTLSEARIVASRARVQRIETETRAAREAAIANYRDLTGALDAARTSVSGNEKMLAGAEIAFRQGEASLTDLMETLRLAAESEVTILDLYEASLRAHRELELYSATIEALDSTTQTPARKDQP